MHAQTPTRWCWREEYTRTESERCSLPGIEPDHESTVPWMVLHQMSLISAVHEGNIYNSDLIRYSLVGAAETRKEDLDSGSGQFFYEASHR